MGVKWEPGMDPGAQGFQPETQSASPRLPDGSVPVSGVVDLGHVLISTADLTELREKARVFDEIVRSITIELARKALEHPEILKPSP